MKTRFVLIQTSHAGNVGAVARAMKTMGFDDLVLVAPRWANVLRREETIQRSSGALDVLARARIVDTLDEALEGMHHLCATAMTPRDFGPPTSTPRAYFEALLKNERFIQQGQAQAADLAMNSSPGVIPPATQEPDPPDLAPAPCEPGVAFLFGSERFGMRNEDVYRCHVALSIPTAPDFGSLNLAAAVQVIAYEWRQALGGFAVHEATAPRVLADAVQVQGMLDHWQQALQAVGFLDPAAPKKLMPRLQQMFHRAQLGAEEIHILRGVAKAMLETARPKR